MDRCSKLTISQIEQLRQVLDQLKSSKNEFRRAQSILLLNEGKTPLTKVIELTRYGRRQIFRLRQNYLRIGLKSLLDKRKGQPKELLAKKQLAEVVAVVKEFKPTDFDYLSQFWTTKILGDWIERQYQIRYKSKTSLYLIFHQAKFTFHKPGRVYQKHNDEEVKVWQENNQLKIFQALEDPNTVVLTEDEMLLSTQTTFQKIWLPEGEYPRVEISNTKKNRSIFGFLNVKTGQEYAFKAPWQNMYETVKILKKIRDIYPKQKLLILWDGAGWHRGKEVQKFMEKDQKIKIIYFPRYAPELNPQEHVWKSGRSEVSHNRFIEDIDQATDQFVNFLNSHRFHYSLIGLSAIS